jgi:antitoxin component YwqK of YwqJK toxin-antitoxin module
MRLSLLFIVWVFSLHSFAQEILKENLTRKNSIYYDFQKTQIQATGSYYQDDLGETIEKHGKWLYFDREGIIEEERNYYRDKLVGKVVLYYPNKTLKQEGYFNYDVQDSVYREWYDNGKLKVEGQYLKGEAAGKWTYYYLDGREKSVEEVIDGVNFIHAFWLPDSLHTQTVVDGTGELLTFYTTGTIKEWYNFKDGLKDGPFEERSTYGYLMMSGHFKLGKKDSTWAYAYYTGATEKISNYKNGVLEGEYTYYYDNGQVNVHGYYKDGKKMGQWTWYTNKGTRDMEGSFVDDLQNGAWTYWYPTGEVSYTANYKDGLKDGIWTYFFKNGEKFKEGSFAKDQKNGTWQTWYENGTLLMKGDYKDGKEEGEWMNYWENGKLKNKTTFKNGLMDGVWLSYFPSGKTKLSGEYEENFKVGEWINYFDNGRVRDVMNYKIFKEKYKVDYGIMKDRVVLESMEHGYFASYSSKDFQLTEAGEYKEGKKDGQWIAYFPGGRKPAVISNYKEGELNGIMQTFDRRGNLMQEVEYKDGLKHGRFIVYDRKGKILVEKEFQFGMQVIKGTLNGPGTFSPN